MPRQVVTPVERTVIEQTPRVEIEKKATTRLRPVTKHGVALVPTYGGGLYGGLGSRTSGHPYSSGGSTYGASRW